MQCLCDLRLIAAASRFSTRSQGRRQWIATCFNLLDACKMSLQWSTPCPGIMSLQYSVH